MRVKFMDGNRKTHIVVAANEAYAVKDTNGPYYDMFIDTVGYTLRLERLIAPGINPTLLNDLLINGYIDISSYNPIIIPK